MEHAAKKSGGSWEEQTMEEVGYRDATHFIIEGKFNKNVYNETIGPNKKMTECWFERDCENFVRCPAIFAY